MPAVSGAGDRPSPSAPEGLTLRHLHRGFLGSGTGGAKLCRLSSPSRPGLSQEQTPSQHLWLKGAGRGSSQSSVGPAALWAAQHSCTPRAGTVEQVTAPQAQGSDQVPLTSAPQCPQIPRHLKMTLGRRQERNE